MKRNILLVLLIVFAATLLQAQSMMVIFREVTPNGTNAQTLELIRMEDPSYPIGSNVPAKNERWLIQAYRDGGDGIISPLDSLGNATGDDLRLTDPVHLKVSQGLYFALQNVWMMAGLRFTPGDDDAQAWPGDKIYIRIFNNTSIAKADKYIVAHSLYTIPATNASLSYVPEFGWDKAGWITFRK